MINFFGIGKYGLSVIRDSAVGAFMTAVAVTNAVTGVNQIVAYVAAGACFIKALSKIPEWKMEQRVSGGY